MTPSIRGLHLPRLLEHSAGGILYAVLYLAWLSQREMSWLLGIWLGVYLALEVLRRLSTRVNQAFLRMFSPFLRENEIRGVHSGVPYLLSSFLVVLIFPKEIAVLSILFLALGDPAASLAGKLYGHLGPRLPGGKSLYGTLGASAVCACVTYSITRNPLQSALFGLIGGIAEALPLPWDDNLSIPLVSAALMYACLHGH